MVCGEFFAIDDSTTAERERDALFQNSCEYTIIKDQKYTSTSVRWPNDEHNELAIVNSLSGMREVLSGRRSGYLFVRIRYDDIFGEAHNTYICRKHERTPDPRIFILIGCDHTVTVPEDD